MQWTPMLWNPRRCIRYLNELAKRYNAHIIWVPQQSDFLAKCRADELARPASIIEFLGDFSNLEITLKTWKFLTDNTVIDSVNDRWAFRMLPRLDDETISLLKHLRASLSMFVEVITGHFIMGTHARRIDLGYFPSDFCRSCRGEEEKEMVLHLK